jgi:site-specific recombinase XerD
LQKHSLFVFPGFSTRVERFDTFFGKTLSEFGFENRKLRMKAIEKNLYLGPKGVLYADWTVRGRRTRKSLKTRHLKEARAALKRLLRGNVNEPGPKEVVNRPPKIQLGSEVSGLSRPSLGAALDDFVANTSFPSPDTIRNLGTCRKIFDRLCSDWETFRPVTIWKAYEKGGHISAPNQLRWFIRKFVRYCLHHSWLDKVIWKECEGMALKIVPSRRIEIPSPELTRDFLAMCLAEDEERGQFIAWLAYSALRITSAAFLRWEEVNLDAARSRRVMKGGREVFIPLLPQAVDLLRRRWERAGRPRVGVVWTWENSLDNEFKKVRRIMRKFAVGLGIDLTYPHALRHHLASVALANGFSPGEVALMLGHQDRGALVLKTYGHVIPTVLDDKVAKLRIAGVG